MYVATYAAENILNWRFERINGRNIPTLIVLLEPHGATNQKGDEAGAISRDTMIDLFRRGEVLPESRTAEEEKNFIEPIPQRGTVL